ncbi:MAG TPA: hypothetical protein VL442_05800 [Mucilaginibacter sp.]|jgi:hypothetical protein|nr:hypothetical protein [Mucilaginibacter sp.]
MSDNNRKSTGRAKKPEVRSQKSGQKAERPKRKAVVNSENPPTANLSAPTEVKEPNPNPTLQTENMEVHHHPEVEKKGIKEYLLEGFMIFIAVMMGFIAENIRENITNKEHARQLTTQLVQDLKADTSDLNVAIRFQDSILKANDTLFTLSQQPLSKTDLKKIQKLIITSHNLLPFHPTGGASAAIKNELHLKQFAESKIISYIAQYEGGTQLAHTVQDIYLQYQRTMLDPFLRQHFTPANLDAAFSHKPLPDAQMRNLTQADLTQLSADMALTKVVSDELVRDYKNLKERATILLKYVQKQYDIEE